MNTHWRTTPITWARVWQIRLRVKAPGTCFICHATNDILLAIVWINTSRKPLQDRAKQIHKPHFGILWEVGIYMLICIYSPEIYGDSAIAFYFTAFFQQIFIMEMSLSFKPRVRKQNNKTMYTLTSPSLCYSLDHINEGSNKQSFEESPPLHFVLVSLVARGQNCPLQK